MRLTAEAAGSLPNRRVGAMNAAQVNEQSAVVVAADGVAGDRDRPHFLADAESQADDRADDFMVQQLGGLAVDRPRAFGITRDHAAFVIVFVADPGATGVPTGCHR